MCPVRAASYESHRLVLTDSGDALTCCIAQFAHCWQSSCHDTRQLHVSESVCSVESEAVFSIYDRTTAVLGCTDTLTQSFSKVQQRQLDVATTLHLFLTMFVTVPMARSTWPLLWGYLGLLVTCLKSLLCANSLNSPQENCGPLSDITTSGTP